jgi:hypothetical protein
MNEEALGKRPGIVIFVAILHFFSAALFLFLSLFCVLAMFFGAVWGIDDFFTRQMTQWAPGANFSYGLTLVFGMALFVFLCFFSFFMALGASLLKGKKFAWYLQVAFSTLGLLSLSFSFLWSAFVLPIGSIFNIIILIFFFQPRVRGYFRID